MAKSREHAPVGGSFTDFLDEAGIRESVEEQVIIRVISTQVIEAMRRRGISRPVLAKRMRITRSKGERILDATSDTTLGSLARAAAAIGKRLRITLVE